LGVEESSTFKQCREKAGEVKSKGKGKGKKGKGKEQAEVKQKRGWIPIVQFWEFKMRKKLNKLSTRLGLPFEMNSLTSSASGTPKGESHSCIAYELLLRGE
jgi:hypothetical protein